MAREIDAATVKAWLSDGAEIAFLDVREAGAFSQGHSFFAIPLAYSRFEIDLPQLVPNKAVRIVLMDGGDGVAGKAAGRAEALGYTSLHVVTGGAPAWQKSGYTLYEGVNVPSKTFGELVEIEDHTPRITADELVAMQARGDDMVIVDGRTPAEYRRFNIPGGVLCPNGELALRIGEIAKDPKTTIVVNCAGRTRSIIGAQTLIDLGVANKVVALENGTQGWWLAGLQVEKGADRLYPKITAGKDLAREKAQAARMATKRKVPTVDAATVQGWLADKSRTTFVFDVRTAEEVAQGTLAGATHAPGGQLIQATDQWVGVKGARLVLVDAEGVRAPVVAGWLRRLGHDASVLAGGIGAKLTIESVRAAGLPAAKSVDVDEAARRLDTGAAQLLDLRPSMSYRDGHAKGARWATRPGISKAVAAGKPVMLMADDALVAAIAALDLADAGIGDVSVVAGGYDAWCKAGLPSEATPAAPSDADCIDFVFHTLGRNDGNLDAARKYLSWEVNLVNQLDEQERNAFRLG